MFYLMDASNHCSNYWYICGYPMQEEKDITVFTDYIHRSKLNSNSAYLIVDENDLVYWDSRNDAKTNMMMVRHPHRLIRFGNRYFEVSKF